MRTSMKWFREPAGIMQDNYDRYGDVWLLDMQRDTAFVLVNHPDLVKQVFMADPAVLRGPPLGDPDGRGRAPESAQAAAASLPWGERRALPRARREGV
jgi:cytochrome P450